MKRLLLALLVVGGVLAGWGSNGYCQFNPHNSCAGKVTVTAGAIVVTAPCANNYVACMCGQFPGVGVTPVAGGLCACAPTSTATVINSATITVGAFDIILAGTPSPSPVVWWYGWPQ